MYVLKLGVFVLFNSVLMESESKITKLPMTSLWFWHDFKDSHNSRTV